MQHQTQCVELVGEEVEGAPAAVEEGGQVPEMASPPSRSLMSMMVLLPCAGVTPLQDFLQRGLRLEDHTPAPTHLLLL